MAFARFLAALFLLPGTLVIQSLGVTVENDGGIFRSLINMLFWGFIGVLVLLPFIVV